MNLHSVEADNYMKELVAFQTNYYNTERAKIKAIKKAKQEAHRKLKQKEYRCEV